MSTTQLRRRLYDRAHFVLKSFAGIGVKSRTGYYQDYYIGLFRCLHHLFLGLQLCRPIRSGQS